MRNAAAQVWAVIAGVVSLSFIGCVYIVIGRPPDESGPRVFLLSWGSAIAIGYLTYLRTRRP